MWHFSALGAPAVFGIFSSFPRLYSLRKEPENHPIEHENYIPRAHCWVQHVHFPGFTFILTTKFFMKKNIKRQKHVTPHTKKTRDLCSVDLQDVFIASQPTPPGPRTRPQN